MSEAVSDATLFPFSNSYARMPERFFAMLPPTPVAEPGLVVVNDTLALELGLDPELLRSPEGIASLAGNHVPEGAQPLAMAYAGHQFGGWSAQLGDGRAILLGEVIGRDGVRRDIQLKGSGPTPFSRMGDGRAALGPVLREYIISEAMHALGIPTTRALAVVTTGEPVYREQPLPGAILTRVAKSHIRVGTFQYFAAREDTDALRLLADHVVARHFPDTGEAENPYAALLERVVKTQAELIASWMLVGFIHGVMNTDNMAVGGETIDYGPCAFMDWYHPETVYSSIDQTGRYAYGNQPGIAQWNLIRLAQALLPLISPDEDAAIEIAKPIINRFADHYETAYETGLAAKFGLSEVREDDPELMQDLLARMAANQADFTLTFRRMSTPGGSPRELFVDPTAFDAWSERWRRRLARQELSETERFDKMRAVNPAVIPRNHLVEHALTAAVERADFAPTFALKAALERPFEDPAPDAAIDGIPLTLPPRPDQVVPATFCGT